MKTRKKLKAKICPLLDRECLKADCEIHNPLLDRCDISVVAYNLYRLTQVERERLDGDSESD